MAVKLFKIQCLGKNFEFSLPEKAGKFKMPDLDEVTFRNSGVKIYNFFYRP